MATNRKISEDVRQRAARAARAAKARLEGDLRTMLESFLKYATQGEKRFLRDVFLIHESSASSEETCEFGLATAFEFFIAGRGEYLCIEDEWLYKAVVKFIAEYRQCQKTGSFEAQPDGWRLWKNRKAAS
jgi:hypothetical protein